MQKLTNISAENIKSRGVQSLADRPNRISQYGEGGLSASELKVRFDRLAVFLADKINEIQNTLASETAGEYIRLALFSLASESEVSLNDLVNSFSSGEFASRVLMLYPSASAEEKNTLQSIINKISKDIASIDTREAIVQELGTSETSVVSQNAVTKEIRRIDINAENQNKRILNIENRISDSYFITDADSKYKKLVPATACPYAGINMLGGMSYYYEANLYTGGDLIGDANYKSEIIFAGTVDVPVTFSYTSDFSYDPDSDMPGPDAVEFKCYTMDGEEVYVSQKDVPITLPSLSKIEWIHETGGIGTISNIEILIESLKHSKVTELQSNGGDSITANILDSRCVHTMNEALADAFGITIEYDTKTQIFTFNGTAKTNINTSSSKIGGHIWMNIKGNNGATYLTKTIVVGGDAEIPEGKYAKFYLGVENTPNKAIQFYGIDIATSTVQRKKLTYNYITEAWWSITEGITFNNLKVKVMVAETDDVSIEYEPYIANTIDTFEIPEALQALPDYGKGIDETDYNYIDFERKVYVQKVASLDLGSLNYSAKIYDYDNGTYIFNSTPIPNLKSPEGISGDGLLCAKFNVIKEGFIHDDVNYAPPYIMVLTADYGDDINAFKEGVKGVELVYALETPIETDISEYLTSEFIEVVGRGSIIFVNEHEQDVPSEVTYLLKEGSV